MSSSFRSDNPITSGSFIHSSSSDHVTFQLLDSNDTSTYVDFGSDVSTFISGSISSKDSASSRGVTLLSGDVVVSGSSYFYDDINLNINKSIYFNNPGGTADQFIKSISDVILEIDADDYLQVNADESVNMTVNNGSTSTRFEMAPKSVDINRTVRTTTDFSANGYLLYVSGGHETVILGGENSSNPIYGSDVKIHLSGSKDTKDSSTRGVILSSGDMVVSGNLYDGEGLGYIKDIEKGSFQATLAANTKQYFPGEDSLAENTYVNYYGFVTAPFSGSFDKVILRTYAASGVGGQLSDLGGITASFHRGYNGSDPINLDTAPDFTEDIKVDLSSHPQSNFLEIVFSGSNFNPGDTYALGMQPDNNWNAGGTLNLNYTIVTSYKVN